MFGVKLDIWIIIVVLFFESVYIELNCFLLSIINLLQKGEFWVLNGSYLIQSDGNFLRYVYYLGFVGLLRVNKFEVVLLYYFFDW